MVEHLATHVFLRRAARAAKIPPVFDERSGLYRMPYGRLYFWTIGVGSIFFFLVGFFAPFLDTSAVLGPYLLFLIGGYFIFLSVVAIVEVFFAEIQFSERFLMLRYRPFGWSCEIRWDQISKITYSGSNQWFWFKTSTGEKIRVSRYRIGFDDFCSFAHKHLPPDPANEFSALIITRFQTLQPY
jgi:hypothetical protein